MHVCVFMDKSFCDHQIEVLVYNSYLQSKAHHIPLPDGTDHIHLPTTQWFGV